MKFSEHTRSLIALGIIAAASAVRAEEAATPVLTALTATTLSGYVDTSAIWKFGTGDGFIPGRAFDGGAGNPGGNKLDGFNLNVVKLALEKPLADKDWSAGYRLDLIYGPDAFGYNTSVNSNPGDFSVQQAYVALRVPAGNGLDLKLGTWSTVLGYEVFESGSNPNYSRSFGWQLEPTQHTGLLAAYKFSDIFSFNAGVANTHMAGINLRSPRAESSKAYTGSVTLTAPASFGALAGGTLTAGVCDGFAGDSTRNTVSLYVGAATPALFKKLALGVAFDYRFDGLNAITPAAQSNWACAIAGYATLQASDKLKLTIRADYTRGSDGTWFDGGSVDASDKQNELGALTATADYTLWANVLSRLELRWDHAFDSEKPYASGSNENAVTLAANVIYKF